MANRTDAVHKETVSLHHLFDALNMHYLQTVLLLIFDGLLVDNLVNTLLLADIHVLLGLPLALPPSS